MHRIKLAAAATITALTLILAPAAMASADEPNPTPAAAPEKPEPFFYDDRWEAWFDCGREVDPEGPVEGWLVIHQRIDPTVFNADLQDWEWSDPVEVGRDVETQPWATDCPYILGEDPNAAAPEDVDPEPVADPTPVYDDPTGVTGTATGSVIRWKVGLA